jgi:hypothetical protein
MRFARRHVILLLAVATVLAGAVGLAIAASDEGGEQVPEQVPTGEPSPTADALAGPGASLEEIAAIATGEPGEVLPPCPEEATVDALKTANIDFGPCDPFPEPGEQTVLPEANAPAPDEGPNDVCLDISLADKSDLGGVYLSLPCLPENGIIEELPPEMVAQLKGLSAEDIALVIGEYPPNLAEQIEQLLLAELPPQLSQDLKRKLTK